MYYLIIVAKFQMNNIIIFEIIKKSLMPRAYYAPLPSQVRLTSQLHKYSMDEILYILTWIPLFHKHHRFPYLNRILVRC